MAFVQCTYTSHASMKPWHKSKFARYGCWFEKQRCMGNDYEYCKIALLYPVKTVHIVLS